MVLYLLLRPQFVRLYFPVSNDRIQLQSQECFKGEHEDNKFKVSYGSILLTTATHKSLFTLTYTSERNMYRTIQDICTENQAVKSEEYVSLYGVLQGSRSSATPSEKHKES